MNVFRMGCRPRGHPGSRMNRSLLRDGGRRPFLVPALGRPGGVLAGDGSEARSPGQDALRSVLVLQAGDESEGRGLVGPVLELRRLEQDESAFGSGEVIEEAPARELADG